MAPGAPTSPLRRLLEDRFTELSSAADELYRDARERARRETAEQLNQAARRMRQAADAEELAMTLADAASRFADGAAVFRIEGDAAQGLRIRGVSETAAERFQSLRIPLSAAAALGEAAATREPVTAAASPAEVSAEMIELAGHGAEGRVSIFPLHDRERVPAVLYCWGAVQTAGAELLAELAAAVWAAMAPPRAEPAQLVQIAAAPEPEPAARKRKDWDELPAEEQQAHLKAQRFARVRTAELRLRESHAVQTGRARRDIYGALRRPIDTAREEFRAAFCAACPSMVDYLHAELVRSLANDDVELLGKDYPGPVV
jgi:DNA gyrase/topoisomerase IV subunit B